MRTRKVFQRALRPDDSFFMTSIFIHTLPDTFVQSFLAESQPYNSRQKVQGCSVSRTPQKPTGLTAFDDLVYSQCLESLSVNPWCGL